MTSTDPALHCSDVTRSHELSGSLSTEKLHVPATPLSALVHYDGDEGGTPQAHSSNASEPAPCLAFASGRAYWWSERVAEAGALALRKAGPVLREVGWRPLQRSSEWHWDPAQVWFPPRCDTEHA